jgi:hypothetical protein
MLYSQNMKLPLWLDKALHQSKTNRSVEARAIYYAAAVFLISFIFGLFFYSGNVPIFGRGSVGTVSLVISTLAALGGYYYVAYQTREKSRRPSLWQQIHFILTNAALAFIHGAIIFLLYTIGFFLVQDAFTGLFLDKYAASVILAASASLAAYAMYLIAARITTLLVSSALAVFLVAGALISMITAEDPYWWQLHLSSLGASSGVSGFAFNATLIIGGLVIVSIADFIANDFAMLQARSDKYKEAKVATIRTVLVLIGVFFACVGLFAYDTYPLIHTASAAGMVFMFVGLISSLPKLVPNFSKAFFSLSFTLMMFLLFCTILYARVGYLNLTAFEIISFVVTFSWLVVFIRQIAAALQDQSR